MPLWRRLFSSMANAIGQPWAKTHPDLMAADHILPGLTREEFRARRQRLLTSLRDRSLVLIAGYRLRYSSLNIFYPFQQNNNLLYLTGLDEPNCALVLQRDSKGQGKTSLFLEENDEHSSLWSGPKTGCHQAVEHFGVDKAYELRELADFLQGHVSEEWQLFLDVDDNHSLPTDALHMIQKRSSASIKPVMDRMRLLKSTSELDLMVKNAKLAGESFTETIRWSKEHLSESALAAKMEFECRLRGASGLAYVPVVAGDDRANIIHYVRNDRPLAANGMVLMDAGAKYGGYCSDITRTWPLGGRFTSAQRDIYEMVLRVQEQCIRAASKWARFPEMSIEILNQLATMLFIEELGRLGFSTPEKAVHRLFPHSIGHYIGLDLHDCQSISYGEPFKEGMTITIEPGLYIPANPAYPSKYHGIGVRIEDDLAITAQGVRILTEGVARQVDALEELLAK